LIYRLLFKLVLRRFDAEAVHAFTARALRTATASRVPRRALRRLLGPRHPSLEIRALGLEFPSPIGVAAGLDKDADWYEALGVLGFGFIEIGTVTALGQAGNERPRIRRLPADRGLLNSMGFPNAGADATAERLRGRTEDTIVGVNVGRSKAVAAERAAEDYRATVRRLGPLADYLVLNVSSPNTPGLRDMQAAEPLEALIAEVREELASSNATVPILIKIAPDLSDAEIDAVADLALALELDGIVAVNTTVERRGLTSEGVSDVAGGVSGAPLKARSLEVLRRLRARTQDKLVLISVGGVETPADAWERILAGATLVQAYTGFVYGGPLWPWRMNRDLAARVRAAGALSIQELVGSAEAATTHLGRSGRSG